MARSTTHAVGASLAARFQTRIKNVCTTKIAEATEETHCFHSVVSAISVVKRAFLLVRDIQPAERMLCGPGHAARAFVQQAESPTDLVLPLGGVNRWNRAATERSEGTPDKAAPQG